MDFRKILAHGVREKKQAAGINMSALLEKKIRPKMFTVILLETRLNYMCLGGVRGGVTIG